MYEYKGSIKKEFISKALDALRTYKSDKQATVDRVKDDISIYKQEYSQLYDAKNNSTVPKTGFILSAVENKQADFTDNFPLANLLAREPSDEETAKTLSKIIPTILDICSFKKVYKRHSRQKIKKGTGIYGVFYNQGKEEIDICELDFMSVYVDMNVQDIQDSAFLFIVEYLDNDLLKSLYPHAHELFSGDVSAEGYTKKSKSLHGKSEIIDCYYKKSDGTLHLMKLCGGEVIEATEDLKGYEKGLYRHGRYPVVFDPMYPDDDSPFGFGIIDVAKNPQMYIDRLDGAILKNCFLAGTPKKMVKKGAGINIDDFLDSSKEVIEVANLDENTYRNIETSSLPTSIISHRNSKITELKECVGNRDFQQGGTSNGVTSGSAITALQEAGDKLSRSQIDDTYDAYKEMITMCIDLMREFYDTEKVYRITNDMGQREYAVFSGKMLTGTEPIRDSLGFEIGTKPRKVEFDISIVPQRQNVYKRETNNQTVTQLFQMGLFNGQNTDAAIMVLKAMNFDGRDGLIQSLTEYKQAQEDAAQNQAVLQNNTPNNMDLLEGADLYD